MPQTRTRDPEPAAPPQAAAPFLSGRFALFDTPDGGIHLAYLPDGADQDEHVQLPAVLVTIARSAAESGKMPGPIDLVRAMRGSKG